MKKSKISLNKKLLLVKECISPLNEQQSDNIVGGATQGVACIQTTNCNPTINSCACPTVLCPPLSRIIACVTSKVTLDCNVCH